MADVAILVLHPLPESPPTGDLTRMVLRGYTNGFTDTRYAVSIGDPAEGWWAELPVLPAPEDRLTTEHVAEVIAMCDYALRDHMHDTEMMEATRRLRSAVRLDSENHVTPHDDEKVVKP